MAREPVSGIALISIRPKYTEKLLSGVKRVEFRRCGPRAEVDRLLVYATLPVGGLVGILEVVSVVRAAPGRLWEEYGLIGGIDRDSFFSYFEGAKFGDALVIGKVWRFDSPVPLEESGAARRAPQSFQYVDSDIVNRLLVRAKPVQINLAAATAAQLALL